MRYARPLALVALLFVASTAGQSSIAKVHPAEQQVLEVERQRFAAMLSGDTGKLNLFLAEELTYTHTSGKTDTKPTFLAAVASGSLKYESIEPAEMSARVYGQTAVVTGRAKLKVKSGSQDLQFELRFTDVYVKRSGRWQLVAWQSTRLQE